MNEQIQKQMSNQPFGRHSESNKGDLELREDTLLLARTLAFLRVKDGAAYEFRKAIIAELSRLSWPF